MRDASSRGSVLVAAVAIASFVGLGLGDAMLGVAWPSIAGELAQPIGALGLVTAASSIGYVAATVLHGRILRRVPLRNLLIAALSGMAVGALAVASSPAFGVLLLAAMLIGLGGGSLDAGVNGFLAVNRGPRLLHLVHAGYGAGTTFGPLLVAAALSLASWRTAYLAAAVLDVLLLLLVLAVGTGWRSSPASAADPAADHSAAAARRAAEEPTQAARSATPLFVGLILLYVAGEATAGQWSFSVLTLAGGMDPAAASLWVASFWAAFTFGRVVAGAVSTRVSLGLLLLGGPLLAVIGLAWLAADPFGAGAIGLPLAGFGFAPVFSSVVLLTTRVLGPRRAPTVIGYQLAGSSVGYAGASLLAGVLADSVGLGVVPIFLAALATALLAALFVTLRRFDVA
ncbi:MAG TPA: MFS transporter [Candidatus Limnocylindria bacterium]|nr:MFS transporter [Candidatus Limnocylindria bacterium]